MSTLEIEESLEGLKRIRRMKGLFLELRGRIGEQIAVYLADFQPREG